MQIILCRIRTCFADSSNFPFATSCDWLDFFDEALEHVCKSSQFKLLTFIYLVVVGNRSTSTWTSRVAIPDWLMVFTLNSWHKKVPCRNDSERRLVCHSRSIEDFIDGPWWAMQRVNCGWDEAVRESGAGSRGAPSCQGSLRRRERKKVRKWF